MNLRDFSARYKKWTAYRRVRDELAAYSDRDLDDIGIRRADIDRIARGSVR